MDMQILHESHHYSLTPDEKFRHDLLSDAVDENLRALGAISLDEFLGYPSISSAAVSDAQLAHDQLTDNLAEADVSTATQHGEGAVVAPPPEVSPVTSSRSISRLHQVCQHVFGNTDALRFDYDDVEGSNSKRCVLTITRPNGTSKTYETPPTFSRKSDAKSHAAAIAIENGAVDFIVTGETDVKRIPALALQAASPPPPPPETDRSVLRIEECCMEWRAGRIKPYWLVINEPKFGRTQGCALRIELSPQLFRVYSVDTIYSSPSEAKKACAETALEEDVLDFIKFGDGRREPEFKLDPNSDDQITGEPVPAALKDVATWTVQGFYETLPQPFPEHVGNKTANEINGPAWLNTTLQSARGAKFVTNFIWTIDVRQGLHGCLLRLERPAECRSYLVDARFAKRAEAKAAVCLLAMSQGIGEYIRAVSRAIEDKLSPAAKRAVNEVILPTLLTDMRKHRSGGGPTFEYETDKDACGCTMIVELAPEQVRKYTVPAEYRNRNDAKTAVLALAAEQGVLEFIRFQGRPPPPGYVPFYAQRAPPMEAPSNRKRKKDWENGGSQPFMGNDHAFTPGEGFRKKPRFSRNTPDRGEGRFGSDASQRQSWGNNTSARDRRNTGAWTHSYMPEQAGAVAIPTQTSYTTGQFQSRPRNAGRSMAPSQSQYGSGSGGHYGYGGSGRMGGAGGSGYYTPPAHSTPTFEMPPDPYRPTNPASATPYYTGAPYPHYTNPIPIPIPANIPQYGQPYPPVTSAYGSYSGASYAQPFQPYTPMPLQQYTPSNPTMATGNQAGAYNPAVPPVPALASVGAHYPNYAVQAGNGGAPQGGIPIPTSSGDIERASEPLQSLAQQVATPPSRETPPASASSDKKVASKRARNNHGKPSSAGPVKVVAMESAPRSNVTALYDYCNKSGMPTPQFFNEIVTESGESKHKVWVIVGKQRLELPVTFPSLSQGQERVAKKVIEQLQAQMGQMK